MTKNNGTGKRKRARGTLRCLVPMEFSAVVVRKGLWEGQKTGGACASLFTLNLPLCVPLRYLSGTEGTRVQGSD